VGALLWSNSRRVPRRFGESAAKNDVILMKLRDRLTKFENLPDDLETGLWIDIHRRRNAARTLKVELCEGDLWQRRLPCSVAQGEGWV